MTPKKKLLYPTNTNSWAYRTGTRYLGRALRDAYRELIILLRHCLARRNARRYRGQTGLKIQFACGPNPKPGWVNIDIHPGAELPLDLRKSLPFDDQCCEITVSEHFLEHLEFPYDTLLHLRECHRITRPGGRIRIGVPDAGGLARQYATHSPEQLAQTFAPPKGRAPWVDTPMAALNFCFRLNHRYFEHKHRYAYDEASLIRVIEMAGFRQAAASPPDPELDSPERMDHTLYVEAVRP